jgi:hypothetical protein
MNHVEPKTIAAAVRANIKQAQKNGTLDPKWKIRVRTERASLCSSVDVRIQGEDLTDEWLFRPEGERQNGAFTDQAVTLAKQVRELMEPAWEWAGESPCYRFASLYFRDGLCAP